MARRCSEGAVTPETRLALTLRLLAGASYLDVAMLFRLGTTTVYVIFNETIKVLWRHLPMPGLPLENLREMQRLADGFSSSRGRAVVLHGCIGALDGLSVENQKPSDEHNPRDYYCRKGMYALPVQAVVDSKYRFLFMSAKCRGSTGNAVAWAASTEGAKLQQGQMPSGFWIAADAAYACRNGLLTPYTAGQLRNPTRGIARAAFNFYHSSLLIHVEQSFGM
jgi:DDE superfamily endonuclease